MPTCIINKYIHSGMLSYSCTLIFFSLFQNQFNAKVYPQYSICLMFSSLVDPFFCCCFVTACVFFSSCIYQYISMSLSVAFSLDCNGIINQPVTRRAKTKIILQKIPLHIRKKSIQHSKCIHHCANFKDWCKLRMLPQVILTLYCLSHSFVHFFFIFSFFCCCCRGCSPLLEKYLHKKPLKFANSWQLAWSKHEMKNMNRSSNIQSQYIQVYNLHCYQKFSSVIEVRKIRINLWSLTIFDSSVF